MRAARRLFSLFVAVLWILVVCISLETYETVRASFASRAHDDYFFVEIGSIPGMTRARDVAVLVGDGLPSAATRPGTTRDTADHAGALDNDRDVVATLQGIVEVEFGRDGSYRASYGEPAIQQVLLPMLGPGGAARRPQDFAKVFERVRYANEIEHHEVSHWGEPWKVSVIPERGLDGQVEKVAVRFQEPPDVSPRQGILADSSWEIVNFRYKKNYNQDGLVTNNFGFKDDDVVVPKPEGLFRVVCIGGSTTEEDNVGMARYADMLEAILRERLGDGFAEVINCGICGLDSYGMRRRVADYLALEPDLVVYYGGVNDILMRHTRMFLGRARGWQKLLRGSRFLNRHFARALMPGDTALTELMKATTMRNLGAIRHAVRESNANLAICSLAYPELSMLDAEARNYLDVNVCTTWCVTAPECGRYLSFATYCRLADLHNGLLAELCERDGLLYVPVAENFNVGIDFFRDICHMKPPGMQLKARVVAACIIEWVEREGKAVWHSSTSYERIDTEDALAYEQWPEHDESLLVEETISVPIQVNGKLRAVLEVPADSDKGAILAAAKAEPKLAKHIEGKNIVKEIFVPGKLVNLVVK